MEIFKDVVQGTEEWNTLRMGGVGGSSISDAVAGGKGISRKNLLYRLAGEILSGVKYEGYLNSHMERGLEQEIKARELYELMSGNEVEQIGLVKESNYTHYSPDGLVNTDGIIEIKCTIPSVHIETIIDGRIPSAYRKQCQWGLHICQRDWVDFVSYSPLVVDKPILIIRNGRDEKLIQELKEGAEAFLIEMVMIVRKIKGV